MTAGEFLSQATLTLKNAGIDTARLDVLILLEDVLRKDRSQVIAHPEWELTTPQELMLSKAIEQRATHLPLAYIRGKAMFYGREFLVTKDVLVPRPETEEIITLTKELSLADSRIADIGTGSGCIGITLALEIPSSSVDLYDIDTEALGVAKRNAAALGVSVQTYQGNLLSDLRTEYDVVVANLPYVPDHFPINKAASMEPALALFSGPDGLNDYKTFWQQAGALHVKPRYILTESLPQQHHANAALARINGYILEKSVGLIQLFTV